MTHIAIVELMICPFVEDEARCEATHGRVCTKALRALRGAQTSLACVGVGMREVLRARRKAQVLELPSECIPPPTESTQGACRGHGLAPLVFGLLVFQTADQMAV